MGEPVEAAYIAVERAYGEGQFSAALAQAMVLLPQLEAGRPDLLDLRLQLLIGHIHCYGLQQPAEAAAAYSLVLEQSADAAYQALARQGLELCQSEATEPAPTAQEATPQPQPAPEAAAEPAGAPEPQEAMAEAATHSPTTAASNTLPATPWLSQLSDPSEALEQIQSAWSTVVPSQRRSTAARLAAKGPVAAVNADTAVVPVEVRVEEEPAQHSAEDAPSPPTRDLLAAPQDASEQHPAPQPASDVMDGEAAGQPPAPEAAPSPPETEQSSQPTREDAGTPFSPEELADYARGWLLVDLSLQPRTRR